MTDKKTPIYVTVDGNEAAAYVVYAFVSPGTVLFDTFSE